MPTAPISPLLATALFTPVTDSPGGVGHDSQSVPGEIFARAHFHLIAEGQ